MSPAQRHTSLYLLSVFVLIAAIALLAMPASSWAALPGANGQIAFTSDRNGNWEIYTTKLDGSPDKRLTTSTAMNSEPSWSPDGSKIAFSVVEPTFSNVYVMNADGSGQTNLTNSVTSNNTNPSWSPDGSRIAFQSDRNGDDEIYSMNSDGSGTPTNLTQDPSAQDFSPSWSPDGAKIAFTKSTFQAGLDVYVVSADGSGQPTNLTASDSSENEEPSWSPDRGRIAFVSNRAGDDDMWLMNATDGSSPQQLTANPATDFAPAWSPDGSRIAFMSDRDGNFDIWAVNVVNGANLVPVTTDPGGDRFPDWQPVPGASSTVTVRNAERPSFAGGQFDLSVDSSVARPGAGDGDAGTGHVSPGVHQVSETASSGTSLDDFSTSISCTKNGKADVAGAGTSIDVAVASGDSAVCTITNALGEPTPAGSGVAVSPPDGASGGSPVTITFANVTAAGLTTLDTSPAGPPPPDGFQLSSSYYYLDTTATFTTAEVCFPYTGSPAPSIMHWVGGTPTPEPTSRDTGSEVCANVSSFSPFALGQFTGAGDVDPPTVACGSPDGAWHADNVSIECTAQDSGSGLADPADAEFALSTDVPPGAEDANASTGSRQVCDAAGNCTTAGPLSANRIDRKAPVLSVPVDMTLDATSPQGVTVTFMANASDGANPSPSVACNPAPGSTFAIGAHIVACTATDHVGNAAHQSFGVTVRGAKEQLNRLIQSVIAASKLPAAAKAQVLDLLRAALAGIDLNKPAQRQLVCTTLTAFATVVRLDSGHGISPAQADQWIADAKRIRAVIGC